MTGIETDKKFLWPGVCIVIAVIVFTPFFSEAQCAMCKAVAESRAGSVSQFAKALNIGILYLLGIPYLLVLVTGYLIYRHRRANRP